MKGQFGSSRRTGTSTCVYLLLPFSRPREDARTLTRLACLLALQVHPMEVHPIEVVVRVRPLPAGRDSVVGLDGDGRGLVLQPPGDGAADYFQESTYAKTPTRGDRTPGRGSTTPYARTPTSRAARLSDSRIG
jgi:hypothetical protein